MNKGNSIKNKYLFTVMAYIFALIPMYIYILCMFGQYEPCPYEVCGELFLLDV